MFGAVGVENLPLGVAKLTLRQRTFCLELLRTGNATEAARRAGYSDPRSDGAKVQKTPVVAAFLARVAAPVAKSADQLIMRVSNRSRALHALLMRELEKPEPTRNGERIKWLTSRVDRCDMLLGSLLGKIVGVHVSGEVSHTHEVSGEVAVTIPATALPVLAQMRRDATQAGLTTASRN